MIDHSGRPVPQPGDIPTLSQMVPALQILIILTTSKSTWFLEARRFNHMRSIFRVITCVRIPVLSHSTAYICMASLMFHVSGRLLRAVQRQQPVLRAGQGAPAAVAARRRQRHRAGHQRRPGGCRRSLSGSGSGSESWSALGGQCRLHDAELSGCRKLCSLRTWQNSD